MANGDDLTGNGNQPAYLRILLAVLKTSGPTVVIALVLVWFMLVNVSTGLNVLRTQMESAEMKMGAFAAEQRSFNERRQTQLDVQLRIMRQTCANGARSDAALKACME